MHELLSNVSSVSCDLVIMFIVNQATSGVFSLFGLRKTHS